MIQGGDFTHGDGTGGESIYGRQFFPDESFQVHHNRKYLLAMAGTKNNNRSQFYITTVKTQWLDGHHVVFGTVVQGEDVVREIERHGTYGGKPKASIVIVDSGELPITPEDRLVKLPVSVNN
jgi:peptidylprolyl isomerase